MTTEGIEQATETVDAADRRRWTWHACMHEAAHLVAAHVLLKKTVKAMVFGDGTGAALVGGGIPASFKEAMVAAAGIMGDVLALEHKPPENVAATPAEVADPQASKPVRAAHGKVMSDHAAVAQWCILNREAEPQIWAERHEWVMSAAEAFVQEHCNKILETAAGLFACGIVTLPAQPAEGEEHVE